MTLTITKSKDARGAQVLELSGVVSAPIRSVWELLADTQRLNADVFGLPAVTVDERHDEGARAHVVMAGMELAFDEKPWVFESPRRYKSVRTFSKGPMERVEAECLLDEVAVPPSTGTSVTYRVLMQTKSGPVGWAAEKVLTAQMEGSLEKLAKLVDELAEGRTPSPFVHPDRARTRERAAKFERPLRAAHDAVLVEGLLEHVASAPDDDVARIRPYALAEKWRQPREAVLALCLDAVGAGLLQMRWETICPSCRGPVHEATALDEVPESHTCELCQVKVDASRTSNVAAVFAPVFDVRRAMKGVFCLGSPQRTPHWLAQLVLAPGAKDEVRAKLGAGRYVVQSPGIEARCVVDVGETGDERVRIVVEGARGGRPPTLPAATPTVKSGTATLSLENADERTRRVQLVNESFGDLSATAAHVVETDAWKRLQTRA